MEKKQAGQDINNPFEHRLKLTVVKLPFSELGFHPGFRISTKLGKKWTFSQNFRDGRQVCNMHDLLPRSYSQSALCGKFSIPANPYTIYLGWTVVACTQSSGVSMCLNTDVCLSTYLHMYTSPNTLSTFLSMSVDISLHHSSCLWLLPHYSSCL